ncbi:uncharacterized protein LOC110821964 [Carica papaya]|uniref:uncharacterized protein LOC110821964 n=1 Tax=Carica papaya TaxID=3649 RepID=UPI000B8CE2A2|nr:uncharacterized protein LOC110821964 [Carica papaya]XP_021907639.1 uncharacterized protein LOC110821964 [Carica papaya]XP_021907640.1 uncharacterized protein LOC110821964 [Carica papaya]
MEEMRLNFNAPLLSVRRFSNMSASSNEQNEKVTESSRPRRWPSLPLKKSDLILDQVTEPVAVPFVWEQIPGRPKNDSIEESHAIEEASVTPSLPPGRVWDIIKYNSEKNFEEQNPVRPQIGISSKNQSVNRLESSKKGINERGVSDLADDDHDGDDDRYSDALDTLSPTDSFSMNCSVSGLTGFDENHTEPSGTFATDPQTRDFMMSRFLPAAKAMALEPPQYALRKQLMAVESEQPRQIRKVVGENRKPPVNQYSSVAMLHYGQDTEDEESEEEYEYNDAANISGKACGLLPRLCFKNSFCLLNPMPGLKGRTHSSLSSISDLGKSSKTVHMESHSQSIKKHAWDSILKKKADNEGRSPRLAVPENKMTCGSNRFMSNSGNQLTRWSSPHRRSGCISPYHNTATQSPFSGVSFLGTPNEADYSKWNMMNRHRRGISKSQELFPRSTRQSSSSSSPAVEKTLYVDTINSSTSPLSNSSLSGTKCWMDSVGEDFETSSIIKEMEGSDTVSSPLQDIQPLSIPQEESILDPKVLGSLDASISFSHNSFLRRQEDTSESRLHPELDQEFKSLECIKLIAGENESIGNDEIKADGQGKIITGFELCTLPPPLPKTPSESWLWRTLPSVSSRNQPSKSYINARFNPKKQDPAETSNNTKWETIVKTSYMHHDHVRYSEEFITHASQPSKS